MTDRSPTATRASLDATLRRVLGHVRVVHDEETLGPPVKCIRCQDRGVIEHTGGEHRSIGSTLNNWWGQLIEVTEENPAYVRCGCQDKPQKAEATKGVYE